MSKKSPRHLSRSLAVQAIYHYKVNQTSYTDIEKSLKEFDYNLYNKADYELMHTLVANSTASFDKSLAYYEPYLERSLNSVTLIEQILLVLAANELVNNLSVPAPVIINEYVELSKLYGGSDSYKFVNHLVDKLSRELRGEEMINYSRK